MSTFLSFALLAAEVAGPPNSRIAAMDLMARVQQAEIMPQGLAEARRKEFAQRYQALVKSMNAFSSKYNASNGEVWPAKEAEKVREAFRKLEQLEPSFQRAAK